MAARNEYKQGMLCWVDVMARDASTLQEFYQKFFGWTAHTLSGPNGIHYTLFQLERKTSVAWERCPYDESNWHAGLME